MRRALALMDFPYDGGEVAEGAAVDVHEKDVHVLTLAGRIRALDAEDAAPGAAASGAGKPDRGRRYRRRDQVAE